jgi:hypothetical protein
MVSIWLTTVNGSGESLKTAKIGFARRSRFLSNADQALLLAILLDSGRSEPGKTVLVDRELPGQEFVDGQRIAATGFLKGKQAAANRGNDFGLATDHPSLGSGGGQIRNRQRTAVGPDDVFYPRAMRLCHGVLTNSQPLKLTPSNYAGRLKICLSSSL